MAVLEAEETNLRMKPFPKLIILDLDGVIRLASRNPESPFYRILHPHQQILKPNVTTAMNLLVASEIPFVIATKQRGLSDGTLTPESFGEMWMWLRTNLMPVERHPNIELPAPYVETKNADKTEQFALILKNHSHLQPHEITLIDDSIVECAAAIALGMNAIHSGDLYGTLCEIFEITP